MTPQDSEHLAVWELLPWLANGRATPAQRARAEAHLPHCPACAASLQHEQDVLLHLQRQVEADPLPSAEAGLARLMQRIDAAETLPERQAAWRPGASRPWLGLGLAGRLSPGLLLGAVGVQALALLVMGIALWRIPSDGELYQTHASAERASGPIQLRVRLDASLSLAQALAVLSAHGMEPRGMQGQEWLLGRSDGRLVDDAALGQLRATPGVLTAERVLP